MERHGTQCNTFVALGLKELKGDVISICRPVKYDNSYALFATTAEN